MKKLPICSNPIEIKTFYPGTNIAAKGPTKTIDTAAQTKIRPKTENSKIRIRQQKLDDGKNRSLRIGVREYGPSTITLTTHIAIRFESFLALLSAHKHFISESIILHAQSCHYAKQSQCLLFHPPTPFSFIKMTLF